MIAAWMLYCVAIGLLFVVLGEALERALHLAGRATRWAWVAALAGSYLVPAAALLRPSAFGALPLPLAHPLATGPITVPQPRGALPPPTRSFSIGDLDTALTWAWGLSAGAVALALLGAGLRLAAWRGGCVWRWRWIATPAYSRAAVTHRSMPSCCYRSDSAALDCRWGHPRWANRSHSSGGGSAAWRPTGHVGVGQVRPRPA